MWPILRLAIIPIIYFIYMMVKKPRTFENDQIFQDGKIVEEVEVNKDDKILSYQYYLKSINQLTFKLKKESFLEKLFKDLKLTKEYSVGNNEFDDLIYIECDDPQVVKLIQNQKILIKNILNLFKSKSNVSFLSFENTYLHVQSELALSEADQKCLHVIRDHVDRAKLEQSKIQKTLILTKLSIVEFLIWMIAGQGAVGILAFIVHTQTQYESIRMLLWYSLGFWLFLFFLSLGVIRIVLGSSSVNVYAVSELLILGIFLYPFASYSIISDYNISFDHSKPRQVEYTLVKHRKVIHRGRKGTSNSYYFDLLKNDQSQYSIEVSYEKYKKIDPSYYNKPSIAIVYGDGRFNIPWIKEVLILNHQ